MPEPWGGPLDRPLVMVVSVWHDDDGVPARIVHGASGPRQTQSCASIDDLMATIRALVEAWDDDPPPPESSN